MRARLVVLMVLATTVVGCSRMYPPVVEGVDDATAAAGSPGAPALRVKGARIQRLPADDPDYVALASGVTPSNPEAPERLVVFKDGVPVLDLGVRTVPADQQGRAALEEQTAVAEDGSAAVIVRTERKNRTEQSTVTWLPAGDPDTAWKNTFEPGRRVLLALPFPAARGVALVTAAPDSPDELRVYGPTGAETFQLKGAAASVSELRVSRSGRFLCADLAFASRPGSPDRAVWVHDVVARTAWLHSWSYGADDEVIAWRLLEDGTLQADTATLTLEIGPGDRVIDRKRRRG